MVEAASRSVPTASGVQRCCGTSPCSARLPARARRGTKDANPKIAWRAATRLRNRIVHGYWDIDVETLVATAVDDLPDMITQLESAIASLQEPEGTDPAL